MASSSDNGDAATIDSEESSVQLVKVKPLTGRENWIPWRIQIRSILKKLRLYVAVETRLDNDEQINIDAYAQLTNSIDQKVLAQMPDTESAFLLWKSLSEKFDQDHAAYKCQVLGEIMDEKLHDIAKTEDFLERMKMRFEKVNTSKIILSEEAFVLMVLHNVGSRLTNAKVALASKEKLRMDLVFPVLIAESQSYKPRSSGVVAGIGEITCYRCGEKGHIARFCKRNLGAENKIVKKCLSVVPESFKSKWIVDTGADDNYTGDKEKLRNITEIDRERFVKMSDGRVLKATHVGETNIENDHSIMITEAVYVPGLELNCISKSRFRKKGADIEYDNSTGSFKFSIGKCYFTTSEIDGLEVVDCYPTGSDVITLRGVCCSASTSDQVLLHKRFGHSSAYSIKDCKVCAERKMRRLPFNSCPSSTDEVLGRVFSDVCGPFQASAEEEKYFVTFIDEKSRLCFVFTIKDRKEVKKSFIEFAEWAETQTGKRIKEFLSDNAKEYMSESFEKYLKEKGIRRVMIPAYSPQQNGVAERKNQTLCGMVRCMLAESKLPANMWSFAVRHANWILNRVPSKATGKIPYEIFFGEKAVMPEVKTFGSLVMRHVDSGNKLAPRSLPAILVGYDEKGVYVYDPKMKRSALVRNVKVFEGEFFDFEKHSIDVDTEKFDYPDDLTEYVKETEDHNYAKDAKHSSFGVSTVAECPNSYREAIESSQKDCWIEAMMDEYQSLMQHDVFDVVPVTDQKLVTSKWIFSIKKRDDGEIERFKARVVARGFTQKYGVDYDEIFSPVVDRDVVRLALVLSSNKGWKVNHIDIGTAFLNGVLDEEVYVVPPEPLCEKGSCWKLKRTLYGLKQSPRVWNRTLTEELTRFGLNKSEHENCLFWNDEMLVVVYVDDMLVASSSETEIEKLCSHLKKGFVVKNLGSVKKFLGVSVKKVDGGFVLDQETYIDDLAERFGISAGAKRLVPLPSGLYEDGVETSKPVRELIGALNYVSQWTRPDICAPVNIVSRKMHQPTIGLWKSATQILRYLIATKDWGLKLVADNQSQSQVYADADYATDDSRKSQSGVFIRMFGCPVLWSSNKQKSIATSSSDAEVVAAEQAVKSFCGMRNLLMEMGISLKLPVPLLEDNKNAIQYVNNKCPKHIDVDLKYVRDKVNRGIIKLEYVASKDQIADVLTKAVSRNAYGDIVNALGIIRR